MRAIQNYIDGKSASASGGRAGRVFDPNTGAQQAEVAFSAALASGVRAVTSPIFGFVTSRKRPLVPGTCAPPMK